MRLSLIQHIIRRPCDGSKQSYAAMIAGDEAGDSHILGGVDVHGDEGTSGAVVHPPVQVSDGLDLRISLGDRAIHVEVEAGAEREYSRNEG